MSTTEIETKDEARVLLGIDVAPDAVVPQPDPVTATPEAEGGSAEAVQ